MEKFLGMRNKKMGETATATMADLTWIEAVFNVDKAAADDLSSWEIINPSDDDEEIEDYSFDEDEEEEEVEDLYVLESPSSDVSSQSPPPDLIIDPTTTIDRTNIDLSIDEHSGYDDYNDGYGNYDDEEEEEEEDEDYDDDYDDELVPRSFSDRFGKQRLMKLGKRAFPKMNNSRKLPCYYHNRPGGVHGKNGGPVWKQKIKKRGY